MMTRLRLGALAISIGFFAWALLIPFFVDSPRETDPIDALHSLLLIAIYLLIAAQIRWRDFWS